MSFTQNGASKNYFRLVDSANVYVNETSAKAQAFLDSIPEPIEDKIKGRLADYYFLKALIHDERSEYARSYHNYVLSVRYAEKEKNYNVAANASLELFAGMYFAKKASIAYSYLDKAKKYYELENNTNGLIEVEQMHAYVEFTNNNYEACNKLLLKNLDKYKKIEDDAYFYLFATYMLTSNFIKLDNLKSAYGYLNEFESLEHNPTITTYNYNSYSAALYISFAEHFFKTKTKDSVFHYLSKSEKYRNSMNKDLIRRYLNLKVDTYKSLGDFNNTKVYLDSIVYFENKMFDKNLEASMQISHVLLEKESELKNESRKTFWNGVLALLLLCVLAFLSVFFFLYYRKNKSKLKATKNKISNLSYLKSNNEKLTGKVLGLEEYILNLKNEVQNISKIRVETEQRDRVKELYKNLHHNASVLLDKSDNQIEIVNDLNVEFFKKIETLHPQLNDSEIITCYYLFMGFKNKEIALFLNISVRALESKRYRISKKIALNTNETTLPDYLQETFKNLSTK
ncbi:helix-turn-helix transcriptional regulator [Mariniflexile sp.]|uniref:helix-turn-helix transcriptional regulator n=1 Tax=Mariniflexile sp. TaxID=1979402 RepID=UPI0035656FB7